MADNTTLNTGSGGDTLRTEDRTTYKTPVSLIDVGGTSAEAIIGDSGVAMPVKGLGSAGTAATGVVTVQGIASMTPLQVADNGGSITVDGTVAISGTVTVGSHEVTNAGTFAVQAAQSGTWNIANVSGTISLPTGAATAAKQPALGTAGTASADVITIQGIASMTALKVDGSAVTQPVSIAATVAVTQSGTWDEVGINDSGNSITVDAPVGTPVFVRLSDGAAAITTLPVSLASVPSHAVTNAGTFAVQVDGTGLTRLTDIETNTDSLAVVGNGAAATALRVSLANDSTGIVALTTSTASIGKLASNSGVDIGDVDVLTLPAITIAAAQTLATVTTVGTVTTVSTLTGGGIAHDSADSGNPIKVGTKAVATLSTATLVAAADRADAVADVDGALLVRTDKTLADLVNGLVAITDGSSTSCIAAQGAGVKVYVTDVVIANSSASNVTVDIRDGTAGTVKATFPVPANGGVVHTFSSPIGFSANTIVAVDPSAAASTVTTTLSGFKSKV